MGQVAVRYISAGAYTVDFIQNLVLNLRRPVAHAFLDDYQRRRGKGECIVVARRQRHRERLTRRLDIGVVNDRNGDCGGCLVPFNRDLAAEAGIIRGVRVGGMRIIVVIETVTNAQISQRSRIGGDNQNHRVAFFGFENQAGGVIKRYRRETPHQQYSVAKPPVRQ